MIVPARSSIWSDLSWSAWMPLMAAHPLALAQLPSAPGYYRLRECSAPETLIWIGWAGCGVREAMERLCRQVHLPVEPFDDPKVPALALWKRRISGERFDVSGVAIDVAEDEEGRRQAELFRRRYAVDRTPR